MPARADHRAAVPSQRACPPVALLAALLALGGCAGAGDWVQTYPDVAARARTDPQAVADEAFAQWDELRGMVGSFQVRARRGVNSRTLDTQIYLLRDGFVEIQVLAPTLQSEGYVGAGRTEVGLWVAEDPCLYRGPNEPGAFGRALGIELTPEDIVATLMGFAVAAPDDATAAWDEEEGRVRVTRGNTTAWLHPVTRRFERSTVRTSSGMIRVELLEWAESGPPVPLRSRVEVEAEDVTLELRLAPEWRANPNGLNPAVFDQMPDVATECTLDELAREGGLLQRGFGG